MSDFGPDSARKTNTKTDSGMPRGGKEMLSPVSLNMCPFSSHSKD